MTSLSIVIVNWNARYLLAKCLESIEKTVDALEVEVILVDNNSLDGSVGIVLDHFPWVRVIANGHNHGFARANNQGIQASGADLVMLLNPDTELRPGAVAALLDCAARHPDAGAIGPRILGPDGSLQASCSPFPTLLGEFWRMFLIDRWIHLATYEMEGWSRMQSRQVDVVQGACLLLRRGALEQVGLLDEDFFIYSEEVDLCRRLRGGGWSILWEPGAEIMHYGGQSTRQAAEEMFIYLYRTKIQYFRKHGGRHVVAAYKLILFAASWARLLLGSVVKIKSDDGKNVSPSLTRNYQHLLQELPNL